MQRQERIIAIVTIVLYLVLILVAVFVWGAYSNWFTTDFEFIYLKSGNTRLLQNQTYNFGNVRLSVHQFGLKKGYSVKIVTALDTNLSYTVDGADMEYALELAGKDVTNAFDIDFDDDGFVLHGRDFYTEDLLAKVYPDSDTHLVSQNVIMYYKMTVTDVAGEHSFVLSFTTLVHALDIEVKPGQIVF